MKIKMLSALDGRYRVGQEVNVPASVATRFIERGYAAPVRELEIERAIVTAPEKAVKRGTRRMKRDVGSD